MTRSRWVAGWILGGAFGLGVLSGGAASLVADRKIHPRTANSYSPSDYADRLAGELSLSKTQRDSVVTVIERHQPAMDSIWDMVRPQVEAERQSIRRDIRALLTPEQTEQYQQLIARKDSLHRASKRHASR
jgi:hypothetical protein